MKNQQLVLPIETVEKLNAAKKSSKFYLTQKEEKKNYYVNLQAATGETIAVPFKAMFFKEGTNKKLGKLTAISNSSTHCSSKKLNMCQLADPDAHCYGCLTEKQYCRKDIINSYESNLISGLILSAANITYLSEYVKQQLKPDYIRFNKHGDFINHQQFIKLLNLVENCKNTIFYGYTCRDDILSSYNITSDFLKECTPNLKINGSNKLYTNRFKVTYSFEEYVLAKNKCLGSCLDCKQCILGRNKKITCLYHGSNSETVLNTNANRFFICQLLATKGRNINPDKLKGGRLFDKLNKQHIKLYNQDLKLLDINTTKELIDYII